MFFSTELDLFCYADCPIKDTSYFKHVLLALGIGALIINAVIIYCIYPRSGPLTKWPLLNLWLGTGLALSYRLFQVVNMFLHVNLPGYFNWGLNLVNCKYWGLFERMSVALLPGTILALFFDSTNDAKAYSESEKRKKIGALTIGMALLLSLPEYLNNGNKCWEILFPNLDGYFWHFIFRALHIIYETLFTFGISLPTSYFMISFLSQMKIKMASLYLLKPVPRHMQNQVSGLRWTCAYILFYHLFYLIPTTILWWLTIWGIYDEQNLVVADLKNILKMTMDFNLIWSNLIFFSQFRFWNIFRCGRGRNHMGQFWRLGLDSPI